MTGRRLVVGLAALLATLTTSPSRAADEPSGFTDDEIVLGRPDAPLTAVIYISVTCSHCAAFERETFPEIERKLIATGRLRLTVREAPTAPVVVASAGFLLARCAGRAKYWTVVRTLLERQAYVLGTPTAEESIVREGEISGLSPDDVSACLSDPATIEAMNRRRQASLDVGVAGTPAFVFGGRRLEIGDRLVDGRYEGGELDYREFVGALTPPPKSKRSE